MTRAVLAAVLFRSLAALIQPENADDPYRGMRLVAGDSHQHAATLYMIEREAKDPPVPGFADELHEHGSSADAYDAMLGGGYDWGSVSHHDTNHPGQIANICIDPASAKYQWWLQRVSRTGFPDALDPTGAAVSPPSNEALALSRVGTSKTVEGEGGFLALTGREFTNFAFTQKGVASREGGHKIVILPGETRGLCASDSQLAGDEYCADEYRLYRWLAASSSPQGVLIQAHPGGADAMDLRPLHPRNAPGGFSDAFVQGIEVSSSKRDPQWEASYQRMLRSGYRVFPAFGSDSHDATSPRQRANARNGSTVCWIETRTRNALVEAMHARRCYYATSFRPGLRFQMRAAEEGAWVPMGGFLDAPDGRVALSVVALNDPRNASGDPRLAKRFDVIELLDADGKVLVSAPCTRSAEGRDLCRLEVSELRVADGAIYPRIRMNDPQRRGCRSKQTLDGLANCGKVVIGSAIYVNWDRYLESAPYRVCRFGAGDLPCETRGCLPVRLDRDQDGYPDGCDVCPGIPNPDQADLDKNGFGDACPRR
jgi:hypothetical protein